MSKKPKPVRSVSAEVHYLKGPRSGALIKEEIWREDGEVVAYNLAYINQRICRVDHGRVLGFDNRHGSHHRHFMGKTEPIAFKSYSAILKRFIRELHELWRLEDEESGG